ncbi:MAG TPA: tetratricopeptide repeat protein [Acetobacteraceae bacterium]
MVDIFDEIDEELRADRAKEILKRYGGLIIAAALLVVAAVAGWQAWRWYQAKQDMLAAQNFIAAMTLADSADAGSHKAAVADFNAIAGSAPADGYRTLARLRAAALDAQSGALPAALVLWTDVATDQDADPLLRDLATLLWAQHQIDTGDPSLLAARLKPLAAPDNAWRPLAEEQLALLDLRQGKTAAAKTRLTRLAQDAAAPVGVRGRAADLLARLGG